MKHTLHLTPDVTGGTGGGATPVKGGSGTPKFPRGAADFSSVSEKVAAAWSAAPGLTLLWHTQAEFAANSAAYKAAQASRSSAGGSRSGTKQTLASLDRKSSAALAFVKRYISNKFEDEDAALAQYPRYGIEKRYGRYALPADRQRRAAALNLMIDAIGADGFAGENYGRDFWVRMQSDYRAALDVAGTEDSTVSTGAASKKNLRDALVKAMKALQHLILANYPDEAAAKFREWGWQREDY